MKAVQIRKYGGPEVLEIVDLPAPTPKANEVLIKVHASSVNPVDWLVRDGGATSFVKVTFPVILGCDLAGEVVEVGSAAKRFSKGDEVFAMMPQDWGAHAELVALPEALLAKKPARMTMEEAGATGTAAMTALLGVRKRGQLSPGKRALINGGSSSVGMAAVQIGNVLGAEITAVCSAASFDLVKGLGAERLIDYRTTDFASQSERYDLVFDCVGTKPYAACKRVLEPKGVHVTTQPRVPTFIRQFMNPLLGHQVFGLITTGDGQELEYLRSLIDAGKLKTVIDKVYPLAEVAQAQEYSKTGRAKGKIVLKLV